MSSSSSLQSHIQRNTEKWIYYVLRYQECADYLRPFGVSKVTPHYDEALQEWFADRSNPNQRPLVENTEGRRVHLEKCDRICRMKPQTIKEYCTIQFACHAGIDMIQCVELRNVPGGRQALSRAHQQASDEYLRRNPDASRPIDFGNPPPEHITNAYFPSAVGPHLLKEEIRYRDRRTGDPVDCKVISYTNSMDAGESFEIKFGLGETKWVKKDDMEYMVGNRVD